MYQGALKSVANIYPSAADEHPSAPQPFVEDSTPAPNEDVCIERIDSSHSFIATSPLMRQVRRQIEQLASIDGCVLVAGESGTGKEVAARMIHKLSARALNPFLKVNCAALPAELLESELYGHEAGALPGATQMQPGKFEIADKGTLLLDDIAGMPLASQPRLLHVLQEGEFARLGASATMRSDVRVIATTDSDLRYAVQDGEFRADLYYRLNGFTINLPPLRERMEDLPYLLNHFMYEWSAAYKRARLPITRRILNSCAVYSWPGNIRELESFVKRYLVLGVEDRALDQLDMSPALQTTSDAEPAIHANQANEDICDLKSVVRDLKQDAEKAAILQALERTKGNKQEAAILLHISLRALHYKVRAYGIESASLRAHGGVGFPDTVVRSTSSAAEPTGASATNSAGKLITMFRAVR